MLYLKKYFTEGLIQVAILLSLCGVRIDVGLESYLLPSWHEMIRGPTSALMQTEFHNLRNRLEDGHSLHPKSVDLDGFFTARRLLGWVRSLDRLQVPRAELEAWLVQRQSDPLPVGLSDQPSPLERTPALVERNQTVPSVGSRVGLQEEEEEEEKEEDKEEGTHHELHQNGAQDERGEEEEEDEEDEGYLARRYRRAEGGGQPEGSYNYANNREQTQNEVDQTVSLQECLRLLEETFPFTDEQQVSDADGRGGDLEHQPRGMEPIILTSNPSLDLELHWQDLLAIMEPENTDADMMASFDHTCNSGATRTLRGVKFEAPQQYCNNDDNDVTEADQEVLLLETPLQHGLLQPTSQLELEPALLPLTPTAELDDQSSARNTFNNSNVNPLHCPPDHRDLLAEDPSEEFCLGLNAEDNLSTFSINLLTQDLVDTIESSPASQNAPYPENLPSFDVSFHSRDLAPSSVTPSPEGNGLNQDLLTSPSSVFVTDEEEDVEDEDDLPSLLSGLLEDAAIMDEMRLLDLALLEGFSPEMAARLEEEGCLNHELARQETGRDDDQSASGMVVTDDQGQLRCHQEDGENAADSDSGLSLNFSHSPASPCASEASSYSSSSSSSSYLSAVGSHITEDEDEDDEEGLADSDMEVEVTIKQEEMDEEEMGAVGGGYPEDVMKPFPTNYGDHKLFNGFPHLEHVGHDHTYNQPRSPASAPSWGKIPTKHTKSSRHDSAKPYHHTSSRHISESKMWGRDERRAQALGVPFSNELIVNLPVEEFNNLLATCQLNDDQLSLIRDIRRRGKNKIAAQNCRKRKLDVVLGLKNDLSGLRRYRSRLLREKQEALRNLQEMKHQLGTLYQEVFSRLRDEEGRPLDAMEYLLHFEPNGSIRLISRQQQAVTKYSKKQRDKKK
ncbi:endoplasmic reticulum membrane sensor NFE2L1a [Pempheris klunzingeri]|uniref:endoplasmic reticulum membrane sensor NFE2L1a n=1 Tax=Pempheris klunzingeri TaxID=3127111 RepID=UPI003980317B